MEKNQKHLQLVLGFKVDQTQAKAAAKEVSKITSQASPDAFGFYKNIEKELRSRGVQLGETLDEMIAKGLEEGAAMEVFAARVDEYQQSLQESVAAVKNHQAELRKEGAELKQNAERVSRYSRAFVVLGGVITGSVIASANRYIQSAEKSDKVAQKWLATSKQLNDSQNRIGKSAAQVLLPVYQKLGDILERVSRVAESNPEVVKAIFGTGVAFTLIGLLGTAVAQGIKIVADVKMLTAASEQLIAGKLMSQAAKDQLLAAGLLQKGKAASLIGGKGLSGLLTSAGLLTATGGATLTGSLLSGLAGIPLGAGINDLITKKTGKGAYTNQFLTVGAHGLAENVFKPVSQKLFGTSDKDADRNTAIFTALIGKITGALDESSPLLQKVANAIKKVNTELSDSEKAFLEWQREDQKIVKAAYQERLRIVKAAEAQEAAVRKETVLQMRASHREFSRQSFQIFREYAAANNQAEAENQKARGDIIAESSVQIQEIEREHQKAMRDMSKEHNDRVADLVFQRDALGLVKEQRRYNEEKLTAEERVNESIAREKLETAERLKELSYRYQQESREREKAFLEARRELSRQRAQAAADQRNSYIREIAASRAAKQAQLQDLEHALNQERQLKQSYYSQMIQDLGGAPLSQISQTTSGSSSSSFPVFSPTGSGTYSNPYDVRTPRYANGGYARGLIRTGENGVEFVMSSSTTKSAEKLLGRKLTQDSLLKGISGQQIIINDNRKFESLPSPWDRNKMNEEIRAVIQEVIS